MVLKKKLLWVLEVDMSNLKAKVFEDKIYKTRDDPQEFFFQDFRKVRRAEQN